MRRAITGTLLVTAVSRPDRKGVRKRVTNVVLGIPTATSTLKPIAETPN